ncbi:hypothetical protein Nocox_32480 [Nonomuraea coxensis DSM 45129]|uniref:Metallothionein n=1 Tax=Nonomuraea coxensis DSM 45129 TaxID=1122611 RepID=A0ABX8UBM7_9ACTN|nr:hypothetical protein [Nonomuraea coxensis]QYC44067.1 hypothetical protein Nocox_32480 [Nonomuraea coxensis DSM 45129]
MVSLIQKLSDQMLGWLVPKAEAAAGSCTCNCSYSPPYSCKNCTRCYRCTDCTAGGNCLQCHTASACC